MSETAGRLDRPGAPALAWRRVEGSGPTVLWLGGYGSDMTGTKVQALADWAQASGRALLRFDYSGHGESEGDFLAGAITAWRGDALDVIDRLTEGPLVLVGSSMGGWLALLVALARPERVRGLTLVAPAADFATALVLPAMDADARAALARDGVWTDAEGQAYSRLFLEDAARWTLLPGPIPVQAPVRILQGGADAAVPWRHALATAEALTGPDVTFTLIRDGDHRLSRPQDLARLIAEVSGL
jgi:pimeloyl-ACP methyl ester carboxylesterase